MWKHALSFSELVHDFSSGDITDAPKHKNSCPSSGKHPARDPLIDSFPPKRENNNVSCSPFLFRARCFVQWLGQSWSIRFAVATKLCSMEVSTRSALMGAFTLR